MKKSTLLVSIAILSFSLTACNSNKNNSDTTINSQQETNIESDESESDSDDDDSDYQSNPENQVGDNSNPSDTNTSNEDSLNKDVYKLDKNLTGQALIDSIAFKANLADGVNMETENTTSYGESYSTYTHMILFDKNYRVETTNKYDNDVTNSIMIYLTDEGVSYMYDEGSNEGIIFHDSDDDMIYEMNSDDPSYFLPKNAQLIDAYVTSYEGQEVIYVEFISNEYGETLNKMWISIEFGIEIRVESYDGDKLISLSETYNIRWLDTVLANTFVPPNDVQFKELGYDINPN